MIDKDKIENDNVVDVDSFKEDIPDEEFNEEDNIRILEEKYNE